MNSILFWIHMTFVPVFGWSQCAKMLTSTQGVSVSMFALAAAFTGLQTWLACSAYRHKPVWATMQVVIIYVFGVIVYGAMIVIAFAKGAYVWTMSDNIAVIASLTLGGLVVQVAHLKKLPWYDPIVKGWINVAVRTVPNLAMAHKIWTCGSGGVSATFVVVFNALTLMRIAQVILTSIKLGEWDRNRKGLIIGEIGNELTWLIVTIIWLLV